MTTKCFCDICDQEIKPEDNAINTDVNMRYDSYIPRVGNVFYSLQVIFEPKVQHVCKSCVERVVKYGIIMHEEDIKEVEDNSSTTSTTSTTSTPAEDTSL
jgi:glycyl-tRNA synthetase alpha subunit